MSLPQLNDTAIRRIRAFATDAKVENVMDLQILNLQLGELGFRVSGEPSGFLTRSTFATLMNSLEKMRGGNIEYVPLFTNFPDERPKVFFTPTTFAVMVECTNFGTLAVKS